MSAAVIAAAATVAVVAVKQKRCKCACVCVFSFFCQEADVANEFTHRFAFNSLKTLWFVGLFIQSVRKSESQSQLLLFFYVK